MASHAPSRHDQLVSSVSQVIGGPAGRRRRYPQPTFGASFVWGAAPVTVLLAAVTMIVSQVLNEPCRSRGWASPAQFTHLCYSDVPSAVGGSHAPQSAGNWIVTSLASWLAPQGAGQLRTAVDLVTILTVVAFVALVVAVVRLAGHRGWDAAMMALSPVVAVTGLISTDLLAISLAFWGLALALPRRDGRRRVAPLLTGGLLLGLATSLRPVAALLLVAWLLCAWRARRWVGARELAAGAVAGWLVPNAIQFLDSPQQWWAYPKSLLNPDLGYGSLMVIPRLLSQGIPEDQRDFSPPVWIAFIGLGVLAIVLAARTQLPRSVQEEWLPLRDRGLQAAAALMVAAPLVITLAGPGVLRSFTTSPPGPGAGKAFWVLGSVAVVAGVVLLVMRAPRRPRLPVVALLLVCGLTAVAPTIPVQAGLWLVPLVALALPSWRVVLAWAAVECVYAGATWLYIYGLSEANRGLPVGWYVVFLLLRLVAWAGLAALAVRLTRHPEFDPVRTRPDPALVLRRPDDRRDWFRDDPAAGLLEPAGSDFTNSGRAQ